MSTLDLAEPRLALAVRFRFVDDHGEPLGGELTPASDQPPQLTNDTTRTLKRTLTGLVLHPGDVADVNPLADRVQPYVDDGADTWPLGVFLFADFPTSVRSYGDVATCSLVDQGSILDQEVQTAFAVGQGANLAAAIAELLDRFGIDDRAIDPTDAGAGQGGLVWQPGTTGTAIVNDLCRQAGFLPIYWDNDGVAVVRVVPDPSVSTADLRYGQGGRVHANSVVAVDVPLDVANTYVVVDSGVTAAPVVGVYRVPDSAPHSEANRGYAVTRTIPVQGLGTEAAGQAIGRAAADEDVQAYQQFTFSSPLDPRHDTFDVVAFDGDSYLERQWTMTLAASGAMTHRLVRVYR